MVRQKPLQYCKVISLQLIKINEKKKKKSQINYWLMEEGIDYKKASETYHNLRDEAKALHIEKFIVANI